MARRNAVRLGALSVLLLGLLLAPLVAAQEYLIQEEAGKVLLEPRQNYQFTGALAIYGSGSGSYAGSGNNGQYTQQGSGSTAVPAQCPADHPQSCSSISQPDYCCPSNNYCAWHNSVVSCCPNGQTCEGGGTVQQTTVYAAGGGAAPATTVYNNPTPTSVVGYAGYCSTLTAVGPGLPTTQAGQCGTILIVEADAIQAAVLSWARLGLMVVGLQVLGGFILLRR